MRKVLGFAFLVAALAAFVANSNAQPPQGRGKGGQGGGFGGMMGGRGGMSTVMLVSNASVQEEIKVTDEQKDKLKGVSEELMTSMGSLREKMAELKDLPKEESAKKRAEIMKEVEAPLEKKINEILKPEQQARLKQIVVQTAYLRAFEKEDVQKELMLTDDQKGKIKSLLEEQQKEMADLMPMRGGNGGGGNKGGGGRGGDPETMKKVTALNKEFTGKAVAILTESQKDTWKKMTGEPFELKMPNMRRKDD